jgi:hypothetical protein
MEGGHLALYEFAEGRFGFLESIPVAGGLFNRSKNGAFLLRWVGTEGERVEVAELSTTR